MESCQKVNHPPLVIAHNWLTLTFRLDVGGKLLTNQLKELVSFRHYDMMKQTYIMNNVKESCCFVSVDFNKDMETCRYVSVCACLSFTIWPNTRNRVDPKKNTIVQEYILPDLSRNKKGRLRQPDDIITEKDQLLIMNNERFTVPEIIFRPDDIG